MTQQTFGRIIADGDDAFIAMVAQSLEEAKRGVPLPDLYENLPPRSFTVSQHAPTEMIQRGAIIPGRPGVAAYGRVFDRNDLWLNARIVRKQPHLARHIVRHEIAHTLPTGAVRQGQLMPLMYKPDGSHPTRWLVGNYIMRPEECRADTIAEAVSGIDSPWDEFHYYGLDVHEDTFTQFVAIHFLSVAPDPQPEPEPEPVPLPLPDPRVAQLQEKLAQVTHVLDTIHELSAPEVPA